MNPRQRFEATFAFQPVDRPMLDFHAEPEVLDALRTHFAVKSENDIRERLNVDFRVLRPEYVGPPLERTPDGGERDIWGVLRKPVPNPTGTYMEPVNRPWADMKTAAEVDAHPWPRADWYDFSHLPALCDAYAGSAIVFGRPGLMDLINGVSFGRGMEQVMLDLALRDEAGLALFRKRFEFMLDYARRGLEAAGGRVDILFFGEDLGTQQALVISPDTWEEIFRPYMQRMIDLAHAHGTKAMMHSCGSVVALIPRFIDMGLDALQAVQPEATGMDPETLAGRFGDRTGGRMVFNGTMSTQDTLPFGTPETIRSEVRRRKRAFAACGGLVLGPCHNIQADTPLENVLAMYDEGAIVGAAGSPSQGDVSS